MRLTHLPIASLFALSRLFAQPKSAMTGEYHGILAGALHRKLHITTAPDGSLTGKLDSIDQGAIGIPCADFHLSGNSLTFQVPLV